MIQEAVEKARYTLTSPERTESEELHKKPKPPRLVFASYNETDVYPDSATGIVANKALEIQKYLEQRERVY